MKLPLSQVRVVDDWLIVSGQTGHIDGQFEEGVEAQTRAALSNVASALESAEARLDHLVKVNIYLIDMNDFDTVNRIYIETMPEPYPARTAVCVQALPMGALVEVEAWAHITTSQEA